MSRLDTGISLSTARTSRTHSYERRNSLVSESANAREAGGSGNHKVTVDVKDDDDDVQIISPRSVAQARMAKRNRRRAAAPSSTHMDLELSLGSSAVPSRKASTRASRNAVIDLTVGNDDEVVPLALGKRKAPQVSPEPSKDVQLTCAICMDTMKEETSTVCGHIFCRPCILGAIKSQKKCPTCRRKLTNTNIHRIYLSSGTRLRSVSFGCLFKVLEPSDATFVS
ncbi:hypothetical protein GOP47_0014437 [Adiantum capillus-veneris]|uniref:RING-type domain-containing protein n=1 Tax=Adiantum capillus-veneris TaxID=13818 RepID=A0A9D4UM18_ADICA|nr:hypothetical protein GOP47_0014437 [Adiantum capillus-veneris]